MLFDRRHRADPALLEAGLIAADDPITINALSGYTGGGKSMIAEFESGEVTGGFVYKTDQTHKHLPEIVARTGLTRKPIFVPQVGQFAQGMIVQVPLHLAPGGPAGGLRGRSRPITVRAASSRSWNVTRSAPGSIRNPSTARTGCS